MRKLYHSSSLPSPYLPSNNECSGPSYTHCTFTQTTRPELFTDSAFTSCTFTSLSSNSNGGVIHFTFTGTLTITSCTFTECNNNVPRADYFGGGCVCIDSGSLVSRSNAFISCTSGGFSAGLLAQSNCESSDVSLCTFINCHAYHGAGLMTFYGPTSSLSSSRFFSCDAVVGGALYHDCKTVSGSLSIADSLFKECHASFTSNRGGGAIEDFRSSGYSSKYQFSFFTHNTSSGVGYDISIIATPLSEESFVYCFTTTQTNALWNTQYDTSNDWLP